MRTRASLIAPVIVIAVAPLVAQAPVFRSTVESVAIDVSVRQGNRAIVDLTKADFDVRDNGRTQTITDVSRETLPVDVTFAVDLSQSVTGATLAALRRAVARVSEDMRPSDRAALLTFDHRVRQVSGLELGRLPDSAITIGQPEGSTSLFDALGLTLMTPTESERRDMIIVFTDGQDTTSVLDAPAVLELAQRSSQAVFVVAATDGTAARPFPAAHQEFFKTLATNTGGYLQVLQRGQDLSEAFARAFDDFRTSYVLRYTLESGSTPGWHEVDVRVTRRGTYNIRARQGYFLGK